MPARSSVLTLPREVLERLDMRIIEQGFGGYESLVAWLEGEGHRVSRSALQRYGRALREQLPSPELAMVRVSTAKARMLLEELRRRGDAFLTTEAALEWLQERIFEMTLTGASLEDLEPLRAAGRTLVDVARARTIVSREKRATRRDAAEDAVREAKRQGMSAEGVRAIRAAVEGTPE